MVAIVIVILIYTFMFISILTFMFAFRVILISLFFITRTLIFRITVPFYSPSPSPSTFHHPPAPSCSSSPLASPYYCAAVSYSRRARRHGAPATARNRVGAVYGPRGIGSMPEALVVEVAEYTGLVFYPEEPE